MQHVVLVLYLLYKLEQRLPATSVPEIYATQTTATEHTVSGHALQLFRRIYFKTLASTFYIVDRNSHDNSSTSSSSSSFGQLAHHQEPHFRGHPELLS